MKNTKIEWTHHTVNLWWGCEKVSEACQNCYAEAMAHRFGKDCFGAGKERWLRLDKAYDELDKLNMSAHRRGVTETVFINSMSDFFDEKIITEIRLNAWANFVPFKNLKFLILTKRANVLANHLAQWEEHIPKNIHFGITAENQKRFLERMECLAWSRRKYFISVEPMLEPIDISKYADKIDWLICGGESGVKARTFREEWATSLMRQCYQAPHIIRFFYKQDGANFEADKTAYTHLTQRIKEFPLWHPKGAHE